MIITQEDMLKIHAWICEIMICHSDRRGVIHQQDWVKADRARTELLNSWGITYDEYRSWCQKMDAAARAAA